MRIATALFISLMLHTQAVADKIPTQQHDPSKCPQKDDPAHRACIADFWREYRPALMSEYLAWKALLPIAQVGDENRANVVLGRMMNAGLYIHNHWEFKLPDTADEQQIGFEDYERVVQCRSAIINVKFWLVAVSSGSNDPDGRQGFAQASRDCEAKAGRSRHQDVD